MDNLIINRRCGRLIPLILACVAYINTLMLLIHVVVL